MKEQTLEKPAGFGNSNTITDVIDIPAPEEAEAGELKPIPREFPSITSEEHNRFPKGRFR